MQAREYLGKARRLKMRIDYKRKLLAELKVKAIGGGSLNANPDKVQTSVGGNRMEEAVIKYADLESDIEILAEALREMEQRIYEATGIYGSVVIALNVYDMTYREVARNMAMSVGTVANWNNKGLEKLEGLTS